MSVSAVGSAEQVIGLPSRVSLVLAAVQYKPSSSAELADRLGIARDLITGELNRLVKAGRLDRELRPVGWRGRRCYVYSVVAEGTQMIRP